jgi:hypothetical protein
MKRPAVNALLDAAAFVAIALLIGTGLLMEFRLPPGAGELHAWGGGRHAAAREVLTVWGWTRHEWGEIHLWIAYTFMAVMAAHLLLHWKWIVCTVSGNKVGRRRRRIALGLLVLAGTILAASAPFFSGVDRSTRGELLQSRGALLDPPR